jgi:hypothetical protein
MTVPVRKTRLAKQELIPHQYFLEVEDSAYLIKALCSTHPVFLHIGQACWKREQQWRFQNDPLE